MKKVYDFIVIGLGAMGSSALYQLSKSKKNILGIDQFSPPHNYGSSHGDTRIIRQALGEGEEYMSLVLRSYDIWQELSNESKTEIINFTGGLIIGDPEEKTLQHGKENFITQTISTAKKYGIEHDLFDGERMKKKFPQFKLRKNEIAYYERKAGFLRPEKCIEAQLEIAKKNEATILTNHQVIDIESTRNSVRVRTTEEIFEAERIIITAGPWISNFISPERIKFEIHRQILLWFGTSDEHKMFLPKHFPVFIWIYGTNQNDAFYGFPNIDGPNGGVKVSSEQFDQLTSAENVNREIIDSEINDFYEKHIRGRIPNLSPICLKSSTCLYTVAPDSRFVIDYLAHDKKIIIASPCSGHGFKHSSAIGEILSELALEEKSKIDISAFRM